MEITGKEFEVECNLDELNIIHKALSVLKQHVKENEGYSKDYLEKVMKLISKTEKYW